MALTTRCPHCRTAFKVVADQLRVRNGLVRCGACGTVFDGRACLEGEGAPFVPAYAAGSQASSLVNNPPALQTPIQAAPAPVAAPPSVVVPPPVPVAPASPVMPVMPAAHSAPAAYGAPAAAPVPAPAAPASIEPPAVLRGRGRHVAEPEPEPADDERDDDDADADADDAEPAGSAQARDQDREDGSGHGRAYDMPAIRAYDAEDFPDDADEPSFTVGRADEDAPGDGIYGDVRTRYSSATDVGRAPPEFLDQDRINTRHTLRRVWGWLCLLALLALAGQLAYVYRTPIAIAAPVLRPAFEALCRPMGCAVGYARRIERIFIESSSLRPPQGGAQADDDGRARLVLAAVLRNRFDKDQEWPALTLSLTDMSDTVIARKIIRPADYLPPGASGPMAAGAEVTVSVPIVVSGLQVNGYQLDKFFP